jgi:hypothetical protein
MLLFSRQIFFRIDGVYRALGYAYCAVNAQLGVDGEKIRAFNKAIYRTDIYAVGVFAADAAFGYNVGHIFLNSISSWSETFEVYWHILVPRRSSEGVPVCGVGKFVQWNAPTV